MNFYRASCLSLGTWRGCLVGTQLTFQIHHWLAWRGSNSESSHTPGRAPHLLTTQRILPGRGTSLQGGDVLSVTAVLGAVAEGATSVPTLAWAPCQWCSCPATGRPSQPCFSGSGRPGSLAETSSQKETTGGKASTASFWAHRVNTALPLASYHLCSQPICQTREAQPGLTLHGEKLGFRRCPWAPRGTCASDQNK